MMKSSVGFMGKAGACAPSGPELRLALGSPALPFTPEGMIFQTNPDVVIAQISQTNS